MLRGDLPAIDTDGSRVMLLTLDFSPIGATTGAHAGSGTQTVRGPRGEVLLAESDGTFVDLCGRRYRVLRSGQAEVQTTTDDVVAEPG